MSEKPESEEFEEEDAEDAAPGGDDVDVDHIMRDVDSQRRRAPKGAEPAWPRLGHFDALDARIGGIRLGLGASFLIMAWLCFGPLAIARGWLCVPILGFIAVLVYHQRIRGLRTQAQRAVQYYRAGLERIRDQW